MMSSEAHSKSKRGFRPLIALVCLSFAIAAIWYFFLRSDPIARSVDQLLLSRPSRGDEAVADDLWALGPKVIPHLARHASKRDTPFSRGYNFAWSKLPLRVRRLFPAPRDRLQLRIAAMAAIAQLGPLAAYGAAREVTEAFTDPMQQIRLDAETAMEWLVPDCPEALKAFRLRLADTNQPIPMRNLAVSEQIWRHTPEFMPLLIRHLAHIERASWPAMVLGYYGSNAAPAIPLLLQLVGSPAVGASYYENRAMDDSRATGATTLGAIGRGTPDVIAALVRAWNYTNGWVRMRAAEAIRAFASSMTTAPPELIEGALDRDNRALMAKLEILGRLGPVAREALPIIEPFTNTFHLRTWVTEPALRDIGVRVEDLAVAAQMAVCRIDPARCPDLLPAIAARLGEPWGVFVFLKDTCAFPKEVIRAVEPLLASTNSIRPSLAASVILCHDPNHSGALAVLRGIVEHGTLVNRMFAGERLWEITGETNHVWPLLEQGLAPESQLGQWSVRWAASLGPPAVPLLRRALWHKDKHVRQQAGVALRKIGYFKDCHPRDE